MLHLPSSTPSQSSSTYKKEKKQIRFNERVVFIECSSEGSTSEDDQFKTRDDIVLVSRPTLSTTSSSSRQLSSQIRRTNRNNLPERLHAGRKRMAEATTTRNPSGLLSLPLSYRTTTSLSSVDCFRWYSNIANQSSNIVPVRRSCVDIVADAIEIVTGNSRIKI